MKQLAMELPTWGLHLIVEADDREALSRGIQGLAIRLARRPVRWDERVPP
jgi:hypothetical protein